MLSPASIVHNPEAKGPRPVIIGEKLGVPPPADGGAQRPLGVVAVQMVLKLEFEARPRGLVSLALVEHLADMSGERHEAEQMLLEQALALLRAALSEDAASSDAGALPGKSETKKKTVEDR